MSSNVYKALFADALFQIFDNWVFRILIALTVLPVLAAFLIGFQQDQISILFGLWTFEYDSFLDFAGGLTGVGRGLPIADAQGLAVASTLTILFDGLAGVVGVTFCIAATAFFVPRMIERGAADILFHKPLSRLLLYLSRFFVGILYVGLLSSVMVSGIYAGLALVSGYHDLGILTAALTLTYSFGLIHAVSMLIGVVTRSTVATILLTVLFLFGNGCIVHRPWIMKEQSFEAARIARAQDEERDEADSGSETSSELEVTLEDEEMHPALKALVVALDVLHYTLPKTIDAPYLAQKMRKAVNQPNFADDETAFTIFTLPVGLEASEPDRAPPLALPTEIHDLLGQVEFAASTEDGGHALALWKRTRVDEEYEIMGRLRKRRENHTRAAAKLEEALKAFHPVRETSRFGSCARGASTAAVELRWTTEAHDMAAVVFRVGEAICTMVVAEGRRSDEPAEHEGSLLSDIDRRSGLDIDAARPDWYGDKLGFDAELKYNILFSIGSSLAFTILILGIGTWRLGRIDF